MSKKKKIIVLSVMVALLVVTGIVNVVLNNNLGANKVGVSSNTTQVSASSQNFYSMYRTERTSTRQQELQFYEALMKSSTSSDDAKKDAESKKLALIAQMEKELVTEGIIIGKGFDDVIVTQSSANVNVFVKSPELTKIEVASISEVVKEQLGVSIDKIIIIPSES